MGVSMMKKSIILYCLIGLALISGYSAKNLFITPTIITSDICQKPHSKKYQKIDIKRDQKAVIFDLGGVLIKTDSWAAFKQIGLGNILFYKMKTGIKSRHLKKHLHKIFYAILNKIEPQDNTHPVTLDEHGDTTPELFHQWLAGTKTPTAIKIRVLQEIQKHPEWFSCKREQRIITCMVNMLFTPKLFAKTRKLIKGSVKFVETCKRLGYEVYILSNWDAESITYVQKRYPKFFSLFNGIVISGQEKCTKPNRTIYERLLKKYQLDENQCWFIDDQKENITAAQSCGVRGIVCPKKGITALNTGIFDTVIA